MSLVAQPARALGAARVPALATGSVRTSTSTRPALDILRRVRRSSASRSTPGVPSSHAHLAFASNPRAANDRGSPGAAPARDQDAAHWAPTAVPRALERGSPVLRVRPVAEHRPAGWASIHGPATAAAARRSAAVRRWRAHAPAPRRGQAASRCAGLIAVRWVVTNMATRWSAVARGRRRPNSVVRCWRSAARSAGPGASAAASTLWRGSEPLKSYRPRCGRRAGRVARIGGTSRDAP